MKLLKPLAVAGVGVFCLTSCNTHPKRYDAKDYCIFLPWNNYSTSDYRILQLTDLHISNMSDNEKQFKFIKKTVEKANHPDLIIITGDLFTFANKSDAIQTFDFFDSLGIPWAPTWGNHDEQNYFSVSWLTSQLNDRNKTRIANPGKSYCVFNDFQDDDVFGNSNYVINLYDGEPVDNKVKEQLFCIDSNRYNYGEGFGYDYIHYDQIDWYERVVHAYEHYAPGEFNTIPSLAFFHIPLIQFEDAYQAALKGDTTKARFFNDDKGERKRHEKSTGAPKKDTGLFDRMVGLGSTKGIFVGHNHESSYLVDYYPNGVKNNAISLCCGIKSTNKVYCDESFLGGQVIKLYKNGGTNEEDRTFEIERILTSYEEI